MVSISKKHQIDIIPFNLFEPSEKIFGITNANLIQMVKKRKVSLLGITLLKVEYLPLFPLYDLVKIKWHSNYSFFQ